jgi:hypothetical protein
MINQPEVPHIEFVKHEVSEWRSSPVWTAVTRLDVFLNNTTVYAYGDTKEEALKAMQAIL